MPLDAICLRAVLRELEPQILNARIEKVQQPARDQLILQLRGGKKLYFNAGVNQPRVQLTELSRENPPSPPMFCMLLRKHLSGGRIQRVTQPPMERAAMFVIDVLDELGQPSTRTLVLEAMGRRSNLILLDADGHIIDCLRRVDPDMSLQRQVLPGMYYRLPPTGERLNPLTAEKDTLFSALAAAAGQTLDQWILTALMGFSPLVARELSFRITGRDGVRLEELSEAEKAATVELIHSVASGEKEEYFTPVMLLKAGEPFDFSFLPVLQYGLSMDCRREESFSALLDRFCESRERTERTKQKGQDLIRTATNARDRARRKLENQRRDYAATQNRDENRKKGELITANLYRMQKGDRELTAEDYYEPDAPEIRISLDERLSPQQNAARYYKLYSKAKTAEVYLRELIQKGETELAYLESVLHEIAQAETEQDFAEIRAELTEGGYLRRQSAGKKQQKRPSPYRVFRSSGGFRILVGRDNLQNDRLTTKEADKRDLWFHAQKIHGSHVILCTAGAEASERDLTEAAVLAAWFSQGRDGGNVPVDYTAVRFVKKPGGARPGMVNYGSARTLYVTPTKEAVENLAKE